MVLKITPTQRTKINMLIYKIRSKFYYANLIEPKRRYLAQNCYFDVKVEPLWRNDEICPNGKKRLGYCTANKFAEISVPKSCFSLCPAGSVLRYNKQRLWQSKVRHKGVACQGKIP